MDHPARVELCFIRAQMKMAIMMPIKKFGMYSLLCECFYTLYDLHIA